MESKLKRTYRKFNKRYFGNRLPNPPEVKIRWGYIDPLMGYQLADEIVLNRRDKSRTRIWEFTLLHEMCHMMLEGERSHHGERFQAAMLRLAKMGAFRNLW